MKKLIIPVIGLIVVFILFSSFKALEHDNKEGSSTKDIVENVSIDGKNLTVKYNLGNMIDEEIPYGNKVTKVIDITNESSEDIIFAIRISEVILSDEDLTYSVLYSYEDGIYKNLNEGISLVKDDNLAYNLVVEKKSSLSFKIEFYSNNQINPTKFTGKLSVISNLSEKDIYRKDIITLQSSILANIKALNGINEKGYFIVDIGDLSKDIVQDFKGYVLIDASDYSDLKYHYFVHNGKYMLNNYNLVENDVNKNKIQDIDENVVNKFSFDYVCSNFNKKNCLAFSSLSFNPNGGKENFYKSSMEVINSVKESFKNKDKLVYIYDVTKDIANNTNVRGYILVNNTADNPEYYIYLTNELYMVTGYNLTKLGAYTASSNTIRSYSVSSYNLSSENMSKVCAFSGFSECVTLSGEKV